VAARRELEEHVRRAQEEAEVARRELAAATHRAQEEAAQRELETAARRELEENVRRAQEEVEAARRELAAATERVQEEAALREREAAARRELEESTRRAQDEAEAARREREEDVRRARQEADAAWRELAAATLRAQEEAGLRELAEAARRELEETLDRAKEDADAARNALAIADAAVRFTRPAPQSQADVAKYELIDWILKAIDQGATTLYLPADQPPFVRIDGQVEVLAMAPPPVSMFRRASAALTAGADGWTPIGEWTWSRAIQGTGNVECQAFSDDRGGGFIIHLPVRAAGLEQQVPRHIANACETREGLIVVSAPFAEDVAAMVDAVVSWNTRRHPGHVIMFGISSNPAGMAFTSDRRLPASDREMTAALQRARREQPDVLVVVADGNVPAADAVMSAAVGRLVIVGVVARTAPRALDILLKSGASHRALAGVFKAGCSWRRVRDVGGRLKVIGDVLVGTTRVSALIEQDDIAGLHRVQDQREEGMRSVDAALAAAVARRTVRLRDAAASAVDRKTLISLVRRRRRESQAAGRAARRSAAV